MAKLVLANEEATEEEVHNAKGALELALGRLVENNTDKPDDNNSNNDDSSLNNNTNEGNSSSGNSNNNTNTNKGDLPKTGGSSAGVIGVFGAMISAIGAILFKKRK